MNHLSRQPYIPQVIKSGIRLKKESVRNFIEKMKKQGVPSEVLTISDYRNHLIIK